MNYLIRRNFHADKFLRIFAQNLNFREITRKLVLNFWSFVVGARKFIRAKLFPYNFSDFRFCCHKSYSRWSVKVKAVKTMKSAEESFSSVSRVRKSTFMVRNGKSVSINSMIISTLLWNRFYKIVRGAVLRKDIFEVLKQLISFLINLSFRESISVSLYFTEKFCTHQ